MLIYTVLYYNVLDCLILQSTILNCTILYCTIPCYTLLVLYPTCTILVLLDTDQCSRHLLLRPPPFRKPKAQHPAADNRMIQNCTIHTRTPIKHVKHSSPTTMHRGLTTQHTIHRTHMVFFSCNKNGRTCKLNQAISQHWARERLRLASTHYPQEISARYASPSAACEVSGPTGETWTAQPAKEERGT